MYRKPIIINGGEVPKLVTDQIAKVSALFYKTGHYPKHWEGRTPLIVELQIASHQEFPPERRQFCVFVNQHGDVSIILEDGSLRALTVNDPYSIIKWHDLETGTVDINKR